ncbi:MAG: [Fe-Fe] hydrogenase large subunit C-terminal domain-containing protein [Sphaerochaetaceae bacterium]
MKTFTELYSEVVSASLSALQTGERYNPTHLSDFNPHHLECLLEPHKFAPVMAVEGCPCTEQQKQICEASCLFDAVVRDGNGNLSVVPEKCTGCAACLDTCKLQHLVERKEVVPVLDMLVKPNPPVYALVAPAFVGQFGPNVTPGKLRSVCKRLGFAGMIEVSLFADILTLKEALEFDRYIQQDGDFLLTSCCCPVWIAMIRRIYQSLIPHIPPSVSPMVACGRAVKALYPGAKTVFIGPCLAKKAEAREPDIADAIDYVLNFHEARDIFGALIPDIEAFGEDSRDHSSRAGRIYARSGGVSEAVQLTLERLRPDKSVPVESWHVSGIPACKALLEDLKRGKIPANFLEGMGCVGGCVGGPRTLISKEEGKDHVDGYGAKSTSMTPVDNPSVLKLLELLGFDSVESLLEHDALFTRNFPVVDQIGR